MDDVTLLLGDCLQQMGEIPDGSVDLICADLPYQVTACRWDTLIPFESLWLHYKRLIRPRGAIVLTASQPFTTELIQSNRAWFKYSLVWEKTRATGFLNAPYRPLAAHEDICVFSPAASTYSTRPTMTFNPQFEVGSPYTDNRTTLKPRNHAFHTQPTSKLAVCDKTERHPRSVLRFSFDQGSHNTQKPVALFEYLIRTYSNEGDTVLDNTMGSGTTIVAAINTGRRAIGIEKDPVIFATATARIAEERARTALFDALPTPSLAVQSSFLDGGHDA